MRSCTKTSENSAYRRTVVGGELLIMVVLCDCLLVRHPQVNPTYISSGVGFSLSEADIL